MSVQWMEQQIHGLEDIRDIIRDIILNRDIILRDIILSGIQFFLLHIALKGLLTQMSSFT